jgi:CheY-like chemotaxis protein
MPRVRPVRVLLVDDNPHILELVRVTFSFQEGLAVCGAVVDGLEAIDAWRALRPDVIIMDLEMPRLDGLVAARRILARDANQVIVLYSASFTAADREEAAAIGVARCVDKWDLDGLPDVVRCLGGSALRPVA